jgi:uncharacterized protein YeeX (DUF496 family)
MTDKNPWVRRFEDALCDLIDQYIRDGMSGSDVQMVLRARADDDYADLEVELQSTKEQGTKC